MKFHLFIYIFTEFLLLIQAIYMFKTILIHLLIFSFPAVLSSPQHSTDSFLINEYQDYWLLKLACFNEEKSCEFQFSILPQQWTYGDLKLKIPKGETEESERRYNLKVVMMGESGSKCEKKLTILIKNGNIDVTVEKIQNEGKPPKPEEKINQLVLKNENELSWLEKNGIVSFLPSISYLDELISSDDNLIITRTFQNIISDEYPCTYKQQYLTDVLGRIESHTEFLQKFVKKEKNLPEVSNAQFDKLRGEENKIQEQIWERANKKEAERKIKEMEGEKSSMMVKCHSYWIVSNKYHEKLKIQLGQRDIDLEDLAKIRRQIEKDEKQLEKIEHQKKWLDQKEERLKLRILKNREKIKGQSQNMDTDKVLELQSNYQRFKELCASSKLQAKNIEKKLVEAKKNLENEGISAENIEEKLTDIRQQLLRIQEAQQTKAKIKKLKVVLGSLIKNKSKIKKLINDCKSSTQDKSHYQNGQLPHFSAYKQKYPSIYKINTFSTAWILNYGVPVVSQYNCSKNKRSIEGFGMIEFINKNRIWVHDENGKEYVLNLRVCSSLLGPKNDFLPVIGDMIRWEGELGDQMVNIYKGKVYRN